MTLECPMVHHVAGFKAMTTGISGFDITTPQDQREERPVVAMAYEMLARIVQGPAMRYRSLGNDVGFSNSYADVKSVQDRVHEDE